jgi:hypothetical protein
MVNQRALEGRAATSDGRLAGAGLLFIRRKKTFPPLHVKDGLGFAHKLVRVDSKLVQHSSARIVYVSRCKQFPKSGGGSVQFVESITLQLKQHQVVAQTPKKDVRFRFSWLIFIQGL